MNNLLPRLEFVLQSLVKKQKFCPHCKSRKLHTLAQKNRLIQVKKCTDCALCFTSPIYQSWITANLYNYLYSATGSTTALPNAQQLSLLKQSSFSCSDKYFGDRLQAIQHYYSGKKLLEIGSSWGYFLYQAKELGYEVTGLEISEYRRYFGIKELGVRIVSSFAELNEEKFDLVYTSHVLEHFTDISTIFSDIYQHLNLNGKLFIEVPNFDFDQFGESMLSIVGAVHPLGFSSEFFIKNLPEYGFKLLGFYNSWADFPEKTFEKSSKDLLILVAEKV
jgi:2-polyprenyl-3-methyl-5-hydroxy-6-metoxy-1,4-benzoquinol methylase